MCAPDEPQTALVRTGEGDPIRGSEAAQGFGEAAVREESDVGHATVANDGHDEAVGLEKRGHAERQQDDPEPAAQHEPAHEADGARAAMRERGRDRAEQVRARLDDEANAADQVNDKRTHGVLFWRGNGRTGRVLYHFGNAPGGRGACARAHGTGCARLDVQRQIRASFEAWAQRD